MEVLQLVMASSVVSEEVQCAPARFSLDGDSIILDTKAKISRAVAGELKRLGVEIKRSLTGDARGIVCWHQALPLVEKGDELGDKTEVLFEIDGDEELPAVVSEMLRLGNDRQSYRHVGENGKARTLLRVTAPPYYTLLRALEQQHENGSAQILAFVQQAPRVWVQAGYGHPLGTKLNPPAGKWLLISPDHHWRFLNEGPFQDIYSALEFSLPDPGSALADQPLDHRIRVPLRLVDGTSRRPVEVWVIYRDAMRQVHDLVTSGQDTLIDRLSFAVAPNEKNPDQPTVILRARQSKLAPPMLVLDALACARFRHVDNLFIPEGKQLHPPLRADAIADLLAGDRERLVWLAPGDHGQFAPRSVADTAFRPLSDWVDYVVDHEAEHLEKWVQSHRFEFEPFVCSEDAPKKKRPPKKRVARDEKEVSENVSSKQRKEKSKKPTKKDDSKGEAYESPEMFVAPLVKETAPSDEIQEQLRKLEQAFTNSDDPLDSDWRRQQWRKMAVTNAQLLHRQDCTVCWGNHFWDVEALDPEVVAEWVGNEQHCAGIKSLDAAELANLLKQREASKSDPSLVAAYVIWSACSDSGAAALKSLHPEAIAYLLHHEHHLPIRVAWMAWVAMYRLSDDDVLLLARARDRMLQRLFSIGLSPEFDMAAFMRSGNVGSNDRYRALRDQVVGLRESCADWIEEPDRKDGVPQTAAYADLMFAFAFAQMGESVHCKELLEAVTPKLESKDAIHRWVAAAFRERIDHALQAKPIEMQLSERIVSQLDELDKMDRYKVDRLRQHSRILEPHVRIDPFRNWHKRFNDELSRVIASLQNQTDREQLNAEIGNLLQTYTSPKERIRLFSEVIPLAPRIGEKFSLELLREVPVLLEHCEQPMDRALLLQRALHVAAHFGQIDLVRSFVDELMKSLPEMTNEYLALDSQVSSDNKEKAESIETLLTQSFRGLRKLGMRDEIGRLYGSVAELVDAHAVKKRSKTRSGRGGASDASRSQRLLLCVAGGWYYFGETRGAQKIVDKVWKVLTSGKLPTAVEQKNLACSYLAAASQADVDEAMQRISDVFASAKGKRNLPSISDKMSTSSHFSILQLNVIESAVLSLISDDFSLNSGARRWLDEDEFLVRSRIHHDVQEAASN